MKKSDILASFIIGEADALLLLLIAKNLKTTISALPHSHAILISIPILFPIIAILGVWLADIIGKKIKVIFQIIKFVGVGSLNTFIDLGVLNLLMLTYSIEAGPLYSLFKGISFVCATTNSYFWNKFWTFGKKEGKVIKTKEFIQFFAIAIGGLIINVITASFIVNTIGPKLGMTANLWANVGGITAAFAAATWDFLGYKFLVFHK